MILSNPQTFQNVSLKLGVGIGLDDIRADEFLAMLVLEEERDRLYRDEVSTVQSSSTI